jgi:hypothetical protein
MQNLGPYVMPRTKLVLSAIKFAAFAYVGYSTGSSIMVVVKEFVSINAEITFPVLVVVALITGGLGFGVTWKGLVAEERDSVAKTARDDIKEAEDKEHKDKIELAASTLTEMKCVELLRRDRSMLRRVVADETILTGLTSLGYTRPATPTSHHGISAEQRISTPVPSQPHKRLSERKLSEEDIALYNKPRRNSGSAESASPYSDSSTAIGMPVYHESKESASPQYVERRHSPVLASSVPTEEIEDYELIHGVPRLVEAPTLFPTQTMPLPLGFAGRRTTGPRYRYKPELSVADEGVEVSTTSPLVQLRAIRLSAPDDGSPQISQRGISSSSNSSRGLWSLSPATSNRSSLAKPSPLISRRGLTSSSHEYTGSSPHTSNREFLPGYSPQTTQRDFSQPPISPMGQLFYPPNTLLRDGHTPSLPPAQEPVAQQMKRAVSDRASHIRAFFQTESASPDDKDEVGGDVELGEPSDSRRSYHRSSSFHRPGAPP